MITGNINISEKSINGFFGIVKYLNMKYSKPLFGRIYIKFDEPVAGNSLKDRRLDEELQDCVPVTAIIKIFPYRHRGPIVFVKRK